MFPDSHFKEDWLRATSRELNRCDPGILETCVHALTLLGYLQETGLPFLFKGGTSLMLHFDKPFRLSRDIDIVCGRPAAEVDAALAQFASRLPFLRMTEDDRGRRGLPRRRHFKFHYRSAVQGREGQVLLDVVEEDTMPHATVERPIRMGFLQPTREVLVRVPTVESLLGDKLTAFAPNTTGVPLRRLDPDGTVRGEPLQVAKQLFDVGVLFTEAQDFAAIAAAYDAVHAQESGYRESRPSREASLDDTHSCCLAVTARKPKILANYPDAEALNQGLDKLRGHLIRPDFSKNREIRRTLAARVAVLAAHLRAGRPLDLPQVRYTGSPEQIAHLRSRSLNGGTYSWIDDLKQTNPEAYHYWLLASDVLH